MSLSLGKQKNITLPFLLENGSILYLAKEIRLISFRILYVQLAFFTSREVKALEELTWVGMLD